MSIEQTNQLILLILNSVLMTLLSSILLGGAWLRQNALLQQMRWQGSSKGRSHDRKITRSSSLNTSPEQLHYSTTNPHPITQPPGVTAGVSPDLKQVRESRQQLSEQYQWSRIGMLTLHMTLLIFSISLFALALRSLLPFDSLISTALFLFTVGTAGLLIGAGCILLDFAKGNTSDDSLGQTLAQIFQQLSHPWKRSSLKVNRPRMRSHRSAEKNRPVSIKATGPSEKTVS